MKTIFKGALLTATIFLQASCSNYTYYAISSNPARLSKYSTFAWLPPFNNTRNSTYNNDITDEKIRNQATADLESRGLHLKAANPDLLVRYSIAVKNGVHTYDDAAYTYVGGGYYPRVAYYGGRRAYFYMYSDPYPVYVGDEIERVPYKEGTLIIDMVDRRTKKVIWRGYGVGDVTNPQSAINDLPKVVDGIINKLPLKKL